MKKIHLTFLSGNIDTTIMLIDSLIVNTSPSDKYFNDLMELQSLISQHFIYGNSIDKEAFLFYIKAEKYFEGQNIPGKLAYKLFIKVTRYNNASGKKEL